MTPCDTCTARQACLVLAPHQPTQEDSLVDGVFTKRIVIPLAGTIVPQHSHAYAHETVVATGSVLVEAEDAPLRIVAAPSTITIPARVKHAFTSLEDGTVLLCVHNVALNGPVAVHEEHQIVG